MKNKLIDIMNSEKEMHQAIKEILCKYMSEETAEIEANIIMKITDHSYSEINTN